MNIILPKDEVPPLLSPELHKQFRQRCGIELTYGLFYSMSAGSNPESSQGLWKAYKAQLDKLFEGDVQFVSLEVKPPENMKAWTISVKVLRLEEGKEPEPVEFNVYATIPE